MFIIVDVDMDYDYVAGVDYVSKFNTEVEALEHIKKVRENWAFVWR